MWWDWHHYDSFWHDDVFWPWSSDCYHLSCPQRRWRRLRNCWMLGSSFDFDKHCTKYSSHCHLAYNCKSDAPFVCHSTCLSDAVTIESGKEPDTMGKGTFKVILDVHHFRPDELTLKVRNQDTIVLQGKLSDERSNKSPLACIASEFTRRYKLPRNYDATQATASMSTDGILTILVPAPPELDDVERLVEIQQTGVYYGSDTKALEDKDDTAEQPESSKDETNKEEKNEEATDKQ